MLNLVGINTDCACGKPGVWLAQQPLPSERHPKFLVIRPTWVCYQHKRWSGEHAD